MSEEGAPLPTYPLLTPSPEAGGRISSVAPHGIGLSRGNLSALSFCPPHPTLYLQGCHFHQRGHWACDGGHIGCVFLDTHRVTMFYTEPLKADRTV